MAQSDNQQTERSWLTRWESTIRQQERLAAEVVHMYPGFRFIGTVYAPKNGEMVGHFHLASIDDPEVTQIVEPCKVFAEYLDE